MNSNGHSSKYGSSGLLPPNRSGSTNSCPKDSDAESELIDMTSNDSCDSFDSYPRKSNNQQQQENDKTSSDHRDRDEDCNGGGGGSSRPESPKGGQQPPVVPSPVKQMAQQFGSEMSGGGGGGGIPFGGLSLPSLAMSMFMPPGGTANGTPGSMMDSISGAEHLASHPHHHYLNALHHQQQQFLFNTSLKLGMAEHHHHSASAFRKVK